MKKEKWQKKVEQIEQNVIKETQKTLIEQKVETNTKHIKLISESLDIVQELLNVYKMELQNGKLKRLNAKNMDFIMSAIVKGQKGQRLALNLDNDSVSEDGEPEINIIKGLDIGKI